MSRQRWWRRNRSGLISLAVLVPVSIASIGGLSWWDDFSSRANVPVTAAEGQPVTLGGSEYGPAKAIVLTSADEKGLAVPPDARVIAVQVYVRPQGKAKPKCFSPVLVEQRTGRRWSETGSDLGVPYDPDSSTSCATATDHTGSVRMLTFYVVPADSAGPFWVDVDVIGAHPAFVRLPVDP